MRRFMVLLILLGAALVVTVPGASACDAVVPSPTGNTCVEIVDEANGDCDTTGYHATGVVVTSAGNLYSAQVVATEGCFAIEAWDYYYEWKQVTADACVHAANACAGGGYQYETDGDTEWCETSVYFDSPAYTTIFSLGCPLGPLP